MTIRDDLVLDISQATNDVKSLGAQLDQMTSVLKNGFADAVGVLNNIPTVSVAVEADSDSVSSSIESAIASADTSGLTDGIDSAVAAADTTVTPTADVSDVEAELEGLSGVEVNVPVTGDTKPLQEDLQGLKDPAGEAQEAISGLDESLKSFTGSMVGASGAATGLASVISRLPTGAIPGAAALVGLAVATDSFFDSAVRSESANQRFNRALGDQAALVKDIDIAGFSTDLFGLTKQVGSGTAALRDSLSTFAEMGNAAGATSTDVAEASEQIAVLSTRAVALNPNLGTVGEVAERMTTALARGGRFAAQFGVSLTSTEIQARALADTGKTSTDQLTQFDKAAAGAALATEKLGDSLKTDIESAAENPIVRLNQLKLEVGALRTEMGKPLVAPVIGIIEDSTPATLAFVEAVGSLSAAFVPLAGAAVNLVAPLTAGFGNALTGLIVTITPVTELIGNVVAGLGDVGPVALVAATAILTFTGVLNVNPLVLLASAVGALYGLIGSLAPVLGVATAAFLTFTGVLSINPILLLVTGIVAVVNAVKNWGKEEEKATVSAERMRATVFGATKTFEEHTDALLNVTSATNDYAITQGRMGQNADALAAITKSGISLEVLNEQLALGGKGFEELTAQMVAAGQVKIEIDGVEQTSEQIRGMNGSLSGLLATEQAHVTQGFSTLHGLQMQVIEYENASKAQAEQLIIKGQLTQAEFDEGLARSQSTMGYASYTQALQFATEAHKLHQAELLNQQATLVGNANAYVALTQSIAGGAIPTTEQYELVAQRLGITVDQAKTFVDQAKTSIDNFVKAAVDKLPTVSSVFDTLTNKSDPTQLTNNLNLATAQILIFGTNLETIRSQGFEKVAEFLTQQGPEAAGQFAAAFTTMTDEQKRALEDSIVKNEEARKVYGDQLRSDIANSSDAAKVFAENATSGFEQGLDFTTVTSEQVSNARGVLESDGVVGPMKETAYTTGSAVGDSLSKGLENGFIEGVPSLEYQAREAVRRAEAAMADEAGIHSPSKLFATIGSQLSAGLVSGLHAGESAVVATARQIVGNAASVLGSQSLALSASGVPLGTSIGTQGGVSLGDVTVEINLNGSVTDTTAEEAGRSAARGFVDEASARLEALIS